MTVQQCWQIVRNHTATQLATHRTQAPNELKFARQTNEVLAKKHMQSLFRGQ